MSTFELQFTVPSELVASSTMEIEIEGEPDGPMLPADTASLKRKLPKGQARVIAYRRQTWGRPAHYDFDLHVRTAPPAQMALVNCNSKAHRASSGCVPTRNPPARKRHLNRTLCDTCG